MTGQSHTFIIQSTQPRSTRQRELQDAAAKSHASRIAHKRKQQTTPTDQQVHVVAQIGSPKCICTFHISLADKAGICKVCNRPRPPTHAMAEQVLCSVYPGFGGFRHEVFVALSEENMSESRPVLDYWDHRVNPRYDLFTEIFNIQHPFLYFIQEIGKPVFEFAGISALGMILQKETSLTTKPSLKILAHRSLAIRRVREQLRSAAWEDGTPVAVIMLAILASTMGEKGEVKHHLQALKMLVDQKGGLQAFPPHERNYLLFQESGFSLGTAFSSDTIPQGFVNVIRGGFVSCDTIVVLERAARATCRYNLLTQTTLSTEKRTNTRYFSDCIEACPVLLAPDTSATILEKMILSSLILYSAAVSESRGRSGWFRASQEYLRRHLPHYRPRTSAEKMCLAWLHILTADSCRRGYNFGMIAEDGMNLLVGFLREHKEFWHGTWPHLQAVLCLFFWPMKISRFWSKSWDALIRDVEESDLPAQANADTNSARLNTGWHHNAEACVLDLPLKPDYGLVAS